MSGTLKIPGMQYLDSKYEWELNQPSSIHVKQAVIMSDYFASQYYILNYTCG